MRRKNGWRHVGPGLVGAIVVVLIVVIGAPLRAQQQDGELDEETLALAKRAYETQCRSCHGAEGVGDGPAARFLATPPRDLSKGDWKYAKESTPEEIARIISEGIDDTDMTPFDDVLTEEEIDAVARYVLLVLVKPQQ